jgi:hypothetical protein
LSAGAETWKKRPFLGKTPGEKFLLLGKVLLITLPIFDKIFFDSPEERIYPQDPSPQDDEGGNFFLLYNSVIPFPGKSTEVTCCGEFRRDLSTPVDEIVENFF